MPLGSYGHGGRYNEPGTNAIYTSFSRTCAFEEFTQNWLDDQPMSAVTMLSLYVRLQRVLDLTDNATLTLLQTTRDEICKPLRHRTGEPTQLLGTAAALLLGHFSGFAFAAALPRYRTRRPRLTEKASAQAECARHTSGNSVRYRSPAGLPFWIAWLFAVFPVCAEGKECRLRHVPTFLRSPECAPVTDTFYAEGRACLTVAKRRLSLKQQSIRIC